MVKTIGGVTAVISLLLGLNQVTGLVQKFRIHHKEFSETMKAGEQEIERGDYRAAFGSFKHAVELDPIDREARAREAQSAMLWLENASATNGSFTETANPLLLVLDNALTTGKGTDAADLLAHIGWANFLKYREAQREGVTVDENYKKALSIDPNNVYAHAMWGHWILWQGGKLDDAKQHFTAALATGRVRSYVRELQLTALMNRPSHDTDGELLKVANDMRKNGESMNEARKRSYILWANFETKLRSHDELVQSLSVLSPADMEATYDWLAAREQSEAYKRWTRDFVIANLREINGNHSEALALYTSLQKQLRGSDSVLIAYVNEGIKRIPAHK